MKKLKPFKAADYLDNEIVIAEYLNAASEDENPDVFLVATSDVAKAHGINQDPGLECKTRCDNKPKGEPE